MRRRDWHLRWSTKGRDTRLCSYDWGWIKDRFGLVVVVVETMVDKMLENAGKSESLEVESLLILRETRGNVLAQR